MSRRGVIAFVVSIGVSLAPTVIASQSVVANGGKYTSSSTNYTPTHYDKHLADQWLWGYQQSLYESLVYGACPGMYVCDCIHTAPGRTVIGNGRYYQVYEHVCVEVNDYSHPEPSS